MELLDRHRTLREPTRGEGSLPPEEVLRIGRELLAGLRVVHERGLVHCDVKAANIMLGPGPAKLIDFGIAHDAPRAARQRHEHRLAALMSPEQLHGEALTPASDLFSLGAVLYEALTGRLPYAGDDAGGGERCARGRRRAAALDAAAGVPDRLDAVILQALRRDPDSRFRAPTRWRRSLAASPTTSRAPMTTRRPR